jgi:hypothetical protein
MSLTTFPDRRQVLASLVLVTAVAQARTSIAQTPQALGDACAAVGGAPNEPYAARYAVGEATLTVIAAQHSTDLEAPTSKLVARLFAATKPDLVLVEGLPASRGITRAALPRIRRA